MIIRLINECEDPEKESHHDVDFVLKLRESCGCRRSEDILSPKDMFEDMNNVLEQISPLVNRIVEDNRA